MRTNRRIVHVAHANPTAALFAEILDLREEVEGLRREVEALRLEELERLRETLT